MRAELCKEGLTIGRHRVARLTRDNGLRPNQERRFKKTADSHRGGPIAPNILGQDFVAHGPGQKWGVDISDVWTAEGWLYLPSAGVMLSPVNALSTFPRYSNSPSVNGRETTRVPPTMSHPCRMELPLPDVNRRKLAVLVATGSWHEKGLRRGLSL